MIVAGLPAIVKFAGVGTLTGYTVKPEGGAATGDVIELRASSDLLSWRTLGPVLAGRWHYWDELIGAGPPPVKTDEGWLLIYHGVATHFAGAGVYQAGAVLLVVVAAWMIFG